jgi:NAD(P)-dependent dehydrogenase (short-subunit alcohol dehydrogenase family)
MASKLFDVSNEIVVITGVCGKLGYEYARVFLECGARVVGIDLMTNSKNDDLSSFFSTNYLFFLANVTEKPSLLKCLASSKDKFGSPSVLINNAAIDAPPSASVNENGSFEDYSEDSWNKVIDVNLKGVYLCCQVFGSAMANARRGSIINVASIYGVVAPDQSLYEYRRQRGEVFFKPVAYSASKSGILNLTRYLAVYWARKHVRVNSLSIAGVFDNQEQEFLQAYCDRIPVGRMANEGDYNGAVLFLASGASQYMTGHNLVIDGGWTAI